MRNSPGFFPVNISSTRFQVILKWLVLDLEQSSESKRGKWGSNYFAFVKGSN